MNTFQPGTASNGASQVELSISCTNLLDMDVFSKSDPVCILYCRDEVSQQWFEHMRTETIQNSLNPEFVQTFKLDYFFEERQMLRFSLYDIDGTSRDVANHDFLGKMECSLGEIVSSGSFTRKLAGPKPNCGSISIHCEEDPGCKEEITLQLSGKKLDRKDWFGKSDPFLAFYRVNENGSFTIAHRTEYIKNTLNPVWKPFTVPVKKLCCGDYQRSILIRCIDWNRDGSEDLIGEFTTNIDELVNGPNRSFELINVQKKAKKGNGYKNSGTVTLSRAKIASIPSFLDFVSHGTQLNCSIAIDFTASNGNPSQPTSLHFIHPTIPNQYTRALYAVGEIIQDYDSDKLFPVLGFGARLPPEGQVSHEFFVNMSRDNPFCEGMPGVMSAYHNCLRQVQLYGPTNFAPIIRHVARFASAKRDGSEYFILLIITDGIITDMTQTKDAIVNASNLPLSIIIVGVGNAEFDAMEELDGDDDGEFGRLRSGQGVTAVRDIVQFVPFRKFAKGMSGEDIRVSQAALAKEVLAEIPDQFLSYMKMNSITPGSFSPPRGGQSTAASASIASPTMDSGHFVNQHKPQPTMNEPPPPYPGR